MPLIPPSLSGGGTPATRVGVAPAGIGLLGKGPAGHVQPDAPASASGEPDGPSLAAPASAAASEPPAPLDPDPEEVEPVPDELDPPLLDTPGAPSSTLPPSPASGSGAVDIPVWAHAPARSAARSDAGLRRLTRNERRRIRATLSVCPAGVDVLEHKP